MKGAAKEKAQATTTAQTTYWRHNGKLIVIVFKHLFTNLYKLCDELVFISGIACAFLSLKMLIMTILKEDLCFISAQRKDTLSRRTSSGRCTRSPSFVVTCVFRLCLFIFISRDHFRNSITCCISSVFWDNLFFTYVSPRQCLLGGQHKYSIEAMIMHNQLRWAGQCVRMSDNRLPRQVLFSNTTYVLTGHLPKRWVPYV